MSDADDARTPAPKPSRLSGLIAPKLIEMISKGKARPSFIVSSIIDVKEAPQFYERASQHLETKVVIKFP